MHHKVLQAPESNLLQKNFHANTFHILELLSSLRATASAIPRTVPDTRLMESYSFKTGITGETRHALEQFSEVVHKETSLLDRFLSSALLCEAVNANNSNRYVCRAIKHLAGAVQFSFLHSVGGFLASVSS